MFFKYDFNGEKKHTMIVAHLVEDNYIINILYEDFEGSNTNIQISNNLSDFFFGENDDERNLIELKKKFIKIIYEYYDKEYTSEKYKVPKYIRKIINKKINDIKL